MHARNPYRPEPWHTPADLAPMDVQGYGHRVALEMGMREASRYFTAAAHVRARPVAAMVWGDGMLPFTNYAEAARFVIGAGRSDASEDTTAQGIRRATASGLTRYGMRWSPGVLVTK